MDNLSAYERKYSLTYIPFNKSDDTITLSSNEGNSNSFNLSFEVSRNMPVFVNIPSSNDCVIKIYNLSGDTARAIQKSGYFIFSIGYKGTLNEVFAGTLASASFGKENSDRYIELNLVSGIISRQDRYFSKSYGKNTKRSKIISDLIAAYNKSYFGESSSLSFDLIKKNDTTFKTSQTVKGDIVQLIASFLPNYNVVVNNKRIEIYQKIISGSYAKTKTPIYELDYNYGLIDINFTSDASLSGINKNYAGATFKTVLYPQIDLNSVIKIKSRNTEASYDPLLGISKEESLYYRVKSIRHMGQIYGGEFVSEIKGELLETMTGK